MTITAVNDSVTYKSPRGDTERPADVVVAVNADGTAIAGGGAIPAGNDIIGKVKIVNDAGTVLEPLGSVLDDAVDSGGSVAVGGIARAGLSGNTLVAAADRIKAQMGLDGALFVRTVPLDDIVSGNANNTDGTITTVITAYAAGKQYLTQVCLTNMHASTVAYVEIKSGTTVKATLPCPPGGCVVNFNPPLPPNAANEVWAFDPSAAVTTLYCSMVGFKSKI